MSNLLPTLRRDQLAKFLPDERSVREFEKLFSQGADQTNIISNLIDGTGLNSDGLYEAPSGGTLISSSTSLYNALFIIDNLTASEKVQSVSTHTALTDESVSVFVDASGGAVNITLPNPGLCLNDGRSYRFGITKLDSTSNVVNILPYNTETIAGSASETVEAQEEVLNFITDGTNWHLVN